MGTSSIKAKSFYHILPLKYLYQMLERKKFVLRKVGTWSDKYECFLDLIYTRLKDESQVDSLKLKESFFGASFSREKDESDAMWQIYSPYMNSVRIEVEEGTLNELCKKVARRQLSLARKKKIAYEQQELPSDVPPKMGQCVTTQMKQISGNIEYPEETLEENPWARLINVKYISDEEMKRILNAAANNFLTVLSRGGLSSFALDHLKYKKRAYRHEEETRLIAYWEHEEYLEDYGKSLALDVEPAEFIKSVIIDPRMCPRDIHNIQDKIHSYNGMEKIPVEKSTIYDSPNSVV